MPNINDFATLDLDSLIGGGASSAVKNFTVDAGSNSLSLSTEDNNFTVDLSNLVTAKYIKLTNVGQNNLNNGALLSGNSGSIGDKYVSVPVLLSDAVITTNSDEAMILNNDTSDNIADTLKMPAGTYIISATLNVESTIKRTNVTALYSLNGVDQNIVGSSAYIRAADGHNNSSSSLFDVITMNDEFEIQFKGRRDGRWGTVTAHTGMSSLILVKVA